MTKKEIAHEVAERTRTTNLAAIVAVQATLDVIGAALCQGKRIELRGFGVFEPKIRASRSGRNPRTGIRVQVPAKRTVKFRPTAEMEVVVESA